MLISQRTRLAAILAFLIILTIPTGFDVYHYIFNFRNIDSILQEPPYNIFGIYITRYLCFPYLFYIYTGFGLLPPALPYLIFSFFIVRNILIFLSFSQRPGTLLLCLVITSLLYSSAASSLAIASLLVLYFTHSHAIAKDSYITSFYRKVEIFTLFGLVFSSITMLPISLLFLLYLKHSNSRLLYNFALTFVFVFGAAFLMPQLNQSGIVNDTLHNANSAFYLRRQLDASTINNQHSGSLLSYLGSLGYSSKFPTYIGMGMGAFLFFRFRIRYLSRYFQLIFSIVIFSIFIAVNFLIPTISPTLGQRIFDGFSSDYSSAVSARTCLHGILMPELFYSYSPKTDTDDLRSYCYRN